MKKNLILSFVFLSFTTLFYACQKDEIAVETPTEVTLWAGEKITLNAQELKASEVLLKNEDFRKWIGLNDELHGEVFTKLTTMTKEERNVIIQKHRTAKSSFAEFCQEFVSENTFTTWQNEKIKTLTNLQTNRNFVNVSEKSLKYAIFRAGRNAKARIEGNLRIELCDIEANGCASGVLSMSGLMASSGISLRLIMSFESAGMYDCWMQEVNCLNG